MIQPSIFNGINFSPDFTRESKYFDAKLQRVKCIYSKAEAYLSFFFVPDTMPGTAPTALLTANFDDGNTGTFSQSGVVELSTGYVYFFKFSFDYPIERNCYFQVTIAGYDDIIFSERCRYIPDENLITKNVVTIIAYNNNNNRGYVDSTYPACMFIEVSDFNCNDVIENKTEYKYSYSRSEILDNEICIKKTITFVNPGMYQRCLLKILCGLQHKTINGVEYCMVGDFRDVQRNDGSEIWDLQAEFVLITNPTFFATGATAVPSSFEPTNLFING